MSDSARAFYDALADDYELIFEDWAASRARQAAWIEDLLAPRLTAPPWRVLDLSCGIGTQSLGLAARGHELCGRDLSPRSVARAREVARQLGLKLRLEVGDMTLARPDDAGAFDAVICCDNALAHLASPVETGAAARAMAAALRPGGVALVTLRDHSDTPDAGRRLWSYGLRERGERSFVLYQLWQLAAAGYESTFTVVEHAPGQAPALRSRSAWFRKVRPAEVEVAFCVAGLAAELVSGGKQPAVLGRR